MSQVIDRRGNSGKSSGNRAKFLKRVADQIKSAMPKIVADRKLDNLGKGGVRVPLRGIKEPTFRHDWDTGDKRFVRPGNKSYRQGDEIEKPDRQAGRSGSGSGNGEGEDDFYVVISRDEFLKYFFDDLELPDLHRKCFEDTETVSRRRAGFVSDGVPERLDYVRSFENSLARRAAVRGAVERRTAELESALETASEEETAKIRAEIEELQARLKSLPMYDHVDLRYAHHVVVNEPATRAVMFCVMDVSGSMGQEHKDLSKRFFTLLYLFLKKQYESVDLVFIRHHSDAKEVSEEEFFESRESGGTVVLPSLKLVGSILATRYGSDWNAYMAQCTDGDAWDADDALSSAEYLKETLLPSMQYAAYVEVAPRSYNWTDRNSDLWRAYSMVEDPRLAMRKAEGVEEIWPVFESLFKKSANK